MNELFKIIAAVRHSADAIDETEGTLCLHSIKGDKLTAVACTHGLSSISLSEQVKQLCMEVP